MLNCMLCLSGSVLSVFFFFQAEDGIRYLIVTGVQTCALFISSRRRHTRSDRDWSSDVCSSDLSLSTSINSIRFKSRETLWGVPCPAIFCDLILRTNNLPSSRSLLSQDRKSVV